MTKILFFLAIFNFVLALTTLPVNSQNQSGFISIDCGLSNASSYIDELTGFTYVSDGNYTSSGVNIDVSADYKLSFYDKQFWSVRSFPEGKRNCYTLKPSAGKDTRYLIRARFLYGNYDNKDLFPSFDLYLGVDLWEKVTLDNVGLITSTEIIHAPTSDSIDVCLVNTGLGDPFISVLELRPLINETYVTPLGSGLQLYERLDLALNGSQPMRYSDDIYDRLWSPFATNVWVPLNTSLKDEMNISKNIYAIPSKVMSTAYTRNRTTGYMSITWKQLKNYSNYYFYLHFAELEKNQSREFNIFMNGGLWYGPLTPKYLRPTTILSGRSGISTIDGKIQMWLNKTANSTQPPILNALEIYELKDLPQLLTNQVDVEAILNIKSAYDLNRESWIIDPCAPKDCVWDGLNCSYNGNDTHRIISLNLSSSGLKGEISQFIAGLTMLEYLDMSNNNISGTVPEFLAELSFLTVLNLKGNNLKGPVPPALLARSKNGLLLSVDDNVLGINATSVSQTSQPSSSTGFLDKKYNFVVPMIISFSGFLLRSVL